MEQLDLYFSQGDKREVKCNQLHPGFDFICDEHCYAKNPVKILDEAVLFSNDV